MKDREIPASGKVPRNTVHQAELATNDEGGPAGVPWITTYHLMENIIRWRTRELMLI